MRKIAIFLFIFHSIFATSLEIIPYGISLKPRERVNIGIFLREATETIGCDFSLFFPSRYLEIEKVEKDKDSLYTWFNYKFLYFATFASDCL
ncbi:MAG: hypothetical protein AB1630_10615 [bacterium]